MDWKWLFFYPEQGIATVNELAAPVDRPILFKLTATSTMNAFYVPDLAGMIYAMPGMQTELNAVINKPGVFNGMSSHYSGARRDWTRWWRSVADPVLHLEGLRKRYGSADTEYEVLHGIDLRLERGEFAALIGPSGSGKSTLLNLIGLLDRPSAGRLVIDGAETATLDDTALTRLRGERIGFVFQHHHLIPAFSAEENVAMPLLIARGRPDAAMFERAGELLGRVGLADRRRQLANRLSGGQQQRVAIARALAMSPALVLADEPTGNLDTHSADEVFALLREVNRQLGTSFLIVTHDPRLAHRCDRIIELVDGRIVSDRPTEVAAGRSPVEGSAEETE